MLYGHRRENLTSYIVLTVWALWQRRNVSPVRYELGFYIPEDRILHSHRRENLKSHNKILLRTCNATVVPASRTRYPSLS
jgi:hypothetical protein